MDSKKYFSVCKYMYVDTQFPKVFRPSFLDFEPSIWWGFDINPEEVNDYPFRHPHNKWLARRYPFKTNTLEIYKGKAAMSLRWHLGGSCFVHTNNMNPATNEFDDDDRYLYLVMAYKDKDSWDGKSMLPRLKNFIDWLAEMPKCPVEAVFCRATNCNTHEQRHLRLTNMKLDPKATDSRLDRCYRRYFGATDWEEYLDIKGKPFLRLQFEPKNPKK